MNVKEKFLELTSRTYPHGTEHGLFNILPNFLKSDEFGNLYHQIGDNPTTMFTSHLDTASHDQKDVRHIIDGDTIMSDGTTILGADDKAGVVVLLYMMEYNVPGLYYFFLGEERGCIGSRKLAGLHKSEPLKNINKVVSFDRRGYDSVITHQLSGRSCSYGFAKELSNQLNNLSKGIDSNGFDYAPDSTGIYTDSAQFIDIYSECTNISVGYFNEHTKYESQNIDHLDKLCQTVIKINWDSLKTHRKPGKYDYSDYNNHEDYYQPGLGYSNYKGRSYDYSEWDFDYNETKSDLTTTVILDEDYFGYESDITYDKSTTEITNVKIHPKRIMSERNKIDQLLTSLEVDFDDLKWDGNILVIKQDKMSDTTLTRNEIVEYLPHINNWIEKEIKYSKVNML